jgi:hypothetical protein
MKYYNKACLLAININDVINSYFIASQKILKFCKPAVLIFCAARSLVIVKDIIFTNFLKFAC